MPKLNSNGRVVSQFSACIIATFSAMNDTRADEGGVSFWVPGLYGSLAATPQQPGWSLATIYYHAPVSAGDVNLTSKADLAFVIPTYVFATPVLGGQAAVSMMAVYGRDATSLASISNSVTGIGDLQPQFSLRWNAGVHNYMTYITADIPVGAYDSTRLSNIGIGHGAVDVGAGYTYLNPQTGHEFSGVLGFTYNLTNPSTQYRNGVDMHFDWGISQFLTKQFQGGLVGYVYKEIGCDSGAGDRVGCFRSQVLGVGPQVGFIFPVGNMQGYLNFKGYGEFAAENRPYGWNAWVTFAISPADPTASAPAKRMITK